MRRIPRNVVVMGIVSFLTDLSSEMILPVILPIFMVANGVTMPAIGLIEGVAESASSLLKLASGWLSDAMKKRKALVVVGYSVSTVVKPLFALAGVWWQFLLIRFAERAGKGIRTAPRDALVAASVDAENRGISFGFHRALDTAGAFMGLLSALLMVWALHLDPKHFTTLFYISFIPGALAVIVLMLGVREKAPPAAQEAAKDPDGGPFSRNFIAYLVVVGLFTLGNSSDAFLVLRAQSFLESGAGDPASMATALVFCLMLAMNAVDATFATWFGSLSDRIGRRRVLLLSFGIYAIAYFGFAFAGRQWMLWGLFAFYGLYYATSSGALKAFVADLVPDYACGRAYGLFNMVIGIVAFPASVIMGVLYGRSGYQLAFSFGGAMALLAAVLLFVIVRPPQAISSQSPSR